MRRAILLWVIAAATATLSPTALAGELYESTRVTKPEAHARTGPGSYPYREKKDYILHELDLRLGDVIVDIGAGDGWWSEHFARAVGPEGRVHAAEVDQGKVEKMSSRFKEKPQVRPYRCKTDNVDLEGDSCDMAFLSQTYHHLGLKTRIEYLQHLTKVVKRQGRLAVIERYPGVASKKRGSHGTALSILLKEAEASGWILARLELMKGTNHYLAIFVQRNLFQEERGKRSEGQKGRVLRV